MLSTLDKYRQDSRKKKEAGGILLGKVYDDRIVIEKASCPNTSDKRGLFFFIRSQNKAQQIVENEFYASDNKRIYLGEWHTHPEDIPSPSIIDEQMIKRQFSVNDLNEDFLILIIQGIQKVYLGIYDGKELQGATQ